MTVRRRVRIFLALLALGSPAWKGTAAVSNETKEASALSRVVAQIDQGTSPSTQDIVAAKSSPSAIATVVGGMDQRSPRAREVALGVLADLGAPLVVLEKGWSPEPSPVVEDPVVVRELVARLRDAERDVRTRACSILVERVTDGLVADHSAQILAALEKQPATDEAAKLLGKTGTASAMRLLRTVPALRDAAPEETRSALARLGDREAESALVEAFLHQEDPRARSRLAHALGYVKTVRAVLTLARELRTPQVYAWNQTARCSMRVHVIEGLHRAFPSERIFWPPALGPSGDAYYEAVETWVTKYLGVTWSTPRPPYLYMEDAPGK
jgi:HEAT repeat protein